MFQRISAVLFSLFLLCILPGCREKDGDDAWTPSGHFYPDRRNTAAEYTLKRHTSANSVPERLPAPPGERDSCASSAQAVGEKSDSGIRTGYEEGALDLR